MELSRYFNPVNNELLKIRSNFDKEGRLISIPINFGLQPLSIDTYDIVIVGIDNENGKSGVLKLNAPDAIRYFLYQLFNPAKNLKIVDLGNVIVSNNENNNTNELTSILSYLFQQQKTVILLGGNQLHTYSAFKAYEKNNAIINITAIDSKFDLGIHTEGITEHNYLGKIIETNNGTLFNYTNIGYQSYFVSKNEYELIHKLFFDTYRLGQMRENIAELEPVLRDTNFVSFDLSAIRQSDSPAQLQQSPNGLYGEEACQISRYCGLSDNLNCFALFGLSPELDINNQSAHLAAQIIWYFIEGFNNRKNEIPTLKSENFQKFIVKFNKYFDILTFFKSTLTNRWWLQIPYQTHQKDKMIISCSYTDYLNATNNDIPDRLWKIIQKII